MPSNVGKKAIATTGSGHQAVSPPATSLNPPTPPAGPVPAPYVYVSLSSTASGTTTKLKIGGKAVLKKGSSMAVERPGNQPSQPTGGDIVTHMVCAKSQVLDGTSSLKETGTAVAVTMATVGMNSATGGPPDQVTAKLLGPGDADDGSGASGGGAGGGKKGGAPPPARGARKAGRSSGPDADKCTTAGHPVDVATGAAVDDQIDLELPGPIVLELSRSYSSARSKERTLLGRGGWALGFDEWVVEDTGDEGEPLHTLRLPDGRDAYFPRLEPGASAFHRAERITLSMERGGGFRAFDHRNRLTKSYRPCQSTKNAEALSTKNAEPRARLTEVRDGYGNAIALEYEADRLARIIDTAGRELRLGYESHGFVSRVEVWASEAVPPLLPGAAPPAPKPPRLEQWVDYGYSPSEELASVTNALGHAEHFEYDGFHRMVKTTLRNGVGFEYEYDEDSGRCVKTWGPERLHLVELDFDLAKQTTLVHGTAEARLYEWNADGLVTAERSHSGLIDRKRVFDRDRLLLSESNGAGETTAYVYDERARLVSRTDPAGNETHWEYDEADRPVREHGPDGLTTELRFDQAGSLVGVSYPTGAAYGYVRDERGRLVELVGPEGVVGRFRYDSHHNVGEAEDGRGAKTFYGYEPLGRARLRIDALGRQSRVEYDALRQPVRIHYPDGTSSLLEYEPLGLVSRHVDALGQVTELRYAGTGVLSELREPDDRLWRFEYDDDERLTLIQNPKLERYRFSYDTAGYVEQEETFDGRLLCCEHDRAERLVRVAHGSGEGWRELFYDKLGNVTREHSADGAAVFERDRLGRLSAAKLSDPMGAVTTSFERDAFGRVVSETQSSASPEGAPEPARTLRYRYDKLGRRTERILPDGQSTRYHYDIEGALVGLEHDGRKVAIERDPLGRETRRHVYEGAVDLWSAYDEMDRLVGQRLTAPTEAAAPSPSDRVGSAPPALIGQAAYRVLTDRRYAYDALGRPTRIDDARSGTTRYQYDPVGRLVEAERGRYREAFEYDATGSLVNVLSRLDEVGHVMPWARKRGSVLVERPGVVYENDDRGRRRAKVESTAEGAERRTEYDWDNRDRLREVRLPGGEKVRFRYDAFGRRVVKERVPASRTDFVAAAKKALAEGVAALEPIERVEFVWDGNVLAADIGAVGSEAASGAGAAAGTGGKADADDGLSAAARIARELERERLGLVRAGKEDADLWAARGRHVRAFVHEVGTFVPALQVEVDGERREVFAYVCDHLGTPKELVDGKGRVAWAAAHSAWGRVLEVERDRGARAVESPFRLLGQYADAETGLCYTRYRYFDAETGRWCSPDPLGIAGGRNLFAYDGSPTTEVDPWGLCARRNGILGEAIAIRWLRDRGFDLLGPVHNRSGHGIDMVARDKSGALVFFEVKANSGRLSGDQAKGADFFVPNRLGRAAGAKGAWKSVDPETQAQAKALQREVEDAGGATGKVLYVDTETGNVRETPWLPRN